MKRDLFAFVVAAGLVAGSAAAGAWELQSAYAQAQPQKGAPGPGSERGDHARDNRGERRDERRDRMTDDERRAHPNRLPCRRFGARADHSRPTLA